MQTREKFLLSVLGFLGISTITKKADASTINVSTTNVTPNQVETPFVYANQITTNILNTDDLYTPKINVLRGDIGALNCSGKVEIKNGKLVLPVGVDRWAYPWE